MGKQTVTELTGKKRYQTLHWHKSGDCTPPAPVDRAALRKKKKAERQRRKK